MCGNVRKCASSEQWLTTVTPMCDSPHMRAPQPTSDLLTAAEVASLLGINRSTVTRWEEAGRLRGVRIEGARWLRYRRSDIEALLAKDAS